MRNRFADLQIIERVVRLGVVRRRELPRPAPEQLLLKLRSRTPTTDFPIILHPALLLVRDPPRFELRIRQLRLSLAQLRTCSTHLFSLETAAGVCDISLEFARLRLRQFLSQIVRCIRPVEKELQVHEVQRLRPLIDIVVVAELAREVQHI